MKYFFDTEFIEGTQKSFFGKTKPTIDLISIGIKAEDGREYYAISKDFNLKEAWNRFDLDYGSGDQRNHPPRKVYWIRENVLKPLMLDGRYRYDFPSNTEDKFRGRYDYRDFVYLIKRYGKYNSQIAEEIKSFTNPECMIQLRCGLWPDMKEVERHNPNKSGYAQPEFYAYYADYDWVVFCWLFGRMIDLPSGFPMYCKDLKQLLDEACSPLTKDVGDYIHSCLDAKEQCSITDIKYIFKYEGNIKDHPDYPKQTNEHNALADAIWNFELYKFLQKI